MGDTRLDREPTSADDSRYEESGDLLITDLFSECRPMFEYLLSGNVIKGI